MFSSVATDFGSWTIRDLAGKLDVLGRHCILSYLNSLPISVLRSLDTDNILIRGRLIIPTKYVHLIVRSSVLMVIFYGLTKPRVIYGLKNRSHCPSAESKSVFYSCVL